MFQLADYLSPERAEQANMQPCVSLRCNCNPCAITYVDLDKFEELNDNYVILKDGESVTCTLCNQTHTSDNKLIKLENQHKGKSTMHIIKCPKCGSANVKKNSVANKVVSYTLCTGHWLDNHECQACFHKF